MRVGIVLDDYLVVRNGTGIYTGLSRDGMGWWVSPLGLQGALDSPGGLLRVRYSTVIYTGFSRG